MSAFVMVARPLAASLRPLLAARRISLSHGQALEITARLYGYREYRVALAREEGGERRIISATFGKGSYATRAKSVLQELHAALALSPTSPQESDSLASAVLVVHDMHVAERLQAVDVLQRLAHSSASVVILGEDISVTSALLRTLTRMRAEFVGAALGVIDHDNTMLGGLRGMYATPISGRHFVRRDFLDEIRQATRNHSCEHIAGVDLTRNWDGQQAGEWRMALAKASSLLTSAHHEPAWRAHTHLHLPITLALADDHVYSI